MNCKDFPLNTHQMTARLFLGHSPRYIPAGRKKTLLKTVQKTTLLKQYIPQGLLAQWEKDKQLGTKHRYICR